METPQPLWVPVQASRASWQIRGATLTLERPLLVGILNLTPDSFRDGGRFRQAEPALARARQLVADGAGMLDLGAESTRPGAHPVEPEEEAERLLPVLRRLKAELEVPLSVDTRHAAVARAALAEGAAVVNDVSALSDEAMAGVVATAGAGLVLMHMRGTPQTMQTRARYRDVVGEVGDELEPALERARAAGIPLERVVVDPGIGFAKTAEQNLELLAGVGALQRRLGRPVMLGPSRKAFIGALLGGAPPDQRDAGTLGACVAALCRGCRIFRVHEVRALRDALAVAVAVVEQEAAWAR
jgi:dihydropteroate synthase